MKILAIETSCDETAAAVVEDLPAGRQVGLKILSNVVASSTAMHEKYGGIVPEVAAREQLKCILPTISEATKDIDYDAIAVTVGPGLIGSLLVGIETAKTMAFVTKKPLIPVNHVLAHMYANFINSPRPPLTVRGGVEGELFPAISLVASGGHTELYLMKSEEDLTWLGGTIDDAAGEAFDKTARLLGFGNRGGAAIEEHARKHDLGFTLPRPLMDGSFNFSFSGLKTAVLREWNKVKWVTGSDPVTKGFAYEIQEAITDVLAKKTMLAAQKYNAKSILLSGGVAANIRLREKLPDAIAPPINLCTDNAVYIAAYAFFRGKAVDWHKIDAIPDLTVEV